MKYKEAHDLSSYIAAIPAERVGAIKKLIDLVKKTAPTVGETFQHGMPYYPLDGEPLFAIASQKHFMAIYITEHDLVTRYRDLLGKVNLGKSCIRFKKDSDLNWDYLEALILESYERRIGRNTEPVD